MRRRGEEPKRVGGGLLSGEGRGSRRGELSLRVVGLGVGFIGAILVSRGLTSRQAGRSSLSGGSTETVAETNAKTLAGLQRLIAEQNATIGLLLAKLERRHGPDGNDFNQQRQRPDPNRHHPINAATQHQQPGQPVARPPPDKEVEPVSLDSDPNTRSAEQPRRGAGDALTSESDENRRRTAYAEHPILAVDGEALNSASLDTLMAPYGIAKGGGSCERDFGNGLVENWRGKKAEYCAPRSESGSRIDCYLIKQTAHHGNGDNLCVGHKTAVNFKDLADGKTPAQYFERYVASRHQQQHSKIRYSKGTWSAACDPVPGKWQEKHFPGWNVNWFNAFQSLRGTDAENGGNPSTRCDVFETAPTLIVERDTFANFFHNSEDFFNTFLALAILKWPLKDLQILITDLYPRGPFWPMWETVFNDGRKKPLDAFEIAQKYGNKRVCFDTAAIAILGAAAPITVASFNTKCSKTALVRAYADLVVAKLGLASSTRYSRFANNDPALDPKRVVVTFMARRSASEWPEKRFCDSKNSFFKCERLQHLGVRKLGRSVRNDDETVKALRSLSRKQFHNGAKVVVQDVDYSTLDFAQQIKTNLDTDVMVGPHGAGLLHNIFMPDRAALVELFIDSSSANRHFHNFAKWQGRKYFSKPFSNPLPTGQLLSLVTEAVNSLDLSKPF